MEIIIPSAYRTQRIVVNYNYLIKCQRKKRTQKKPYVSKISYIFVDNL